MCHLYWLLQHLINSNHHFVLKYHSISHVWKGGTIVINKSRKISITYVNRRDSVGWTFLFSLDYIKIAAETSAWGDNSGPLPSVGLEQTE